MDSNQRSAVYPGNVVIEEGALIETAESFLLFRSREPVGLHVARGAAVYAGSMFDLGPVARARVGEYAMLNGVWVIADAGVEIGDYALLSWRVVLMDSYRVPADPLARRPLLKEALRRAGPIRLPLDGGPGQPIRVGRAAWIGFDSVILPGVTVGDGAIVGARSVVTADVEPRTVVGGNPARLIRRLTGESAVFGEPAEYRAAGRHEVTSS